MPESSMYDLIVHGFGDGATAGACPAGRADGDTGTADDDGVTDAGTADGSGRDTTMALGNPGGALGSAGTATAEGA
jgi:hypothetical protein